MTTTPHPYQRELDRIAAEKPIEDEHKRFQAYLIENGGDQFSILRDNTGYYRGFGTQSEWNAWYASSLVKR